MGMRKDFGSDLDPLNLASVAARTTTTTHSSVDRSNYGGRCKARLKSSAGTGTTPTLNAKLQDSPDNSTWSDITGATFAEVTDAAAANEDINVDLDTAARYIRAVGTIAGTNPSFSYGIDLLPGGNPDASVG